MKDLVIDIPDAFFAEQCKLLADDIAREPVITRQMEEYRLESLAKAEVYRKKLEGGRCS